jgi:hypothetical protein
MTLCRVRFGEMLQPHGARKAMTKAKCRRWMPLSCVSPGIAAGTLRRRFIQAVVSWSSV